jgi:threonine dehydrogenase-like Zn-dependent dehydrogenase
MRSRYIEFSSPGTVTLRQEEVDTDGLGRDEVVVRSDCSLISAGTELARLRGEGEGNGCFPSRPGYAVVGRVVAAGPGSSGVAVGDRVFCAGKHAAVQRFQHGQDHQWGRCYPVPDGLADEDAVFACLAQIALVAPWTAEAGPGDTVAVFGLGLIGNLCAQHYRMMGARVIGLDPVSARCAIARRCGIAETIDCPPGEQVAAVRRLTGDAGATVTVDAVGHGAVALAAAQATALLGQCVLLGTPRTRFDADLTVLLSHVHLQGIALRGAHVWRFPATSQRGSRRTVADAYRLCFAMIGEGRLMVAPLRSHLAQPEEAPALYRELQEARDSAWGVVFRWT